MYQNKMIRQKIMSSFEIFTLLFSIVAFSSLVSIPVASAESDFIPNPETESALGCCYDTEQGLCSPVSKKGECEAEENAEWYADQFCNLGGGICNNVCCKIGANNIWTTERACAKQSELAGIVSEFDAGVASEMDCISLSTENELGACIIEIGYEESCIFTSSAECTSNGGDFSKETLCSNAELNTSCVKQDHIGCMEGRDGIYWYDSCGNPENIYSSNEDTSWNNGMVLSPDQSCNPTSSNSNSDSCGNCDYNDGSVCSEATLSSDKEMRAGAFTCRDLSCKNAPSRVDAKGEVLGILDRSNGESWCVYDGPIGGGIAFSQDLVGSRHYRYVCSNGEVKVDPCKDYREEICVEKTAESGDSSASCRVNTWEQCLSANSGGDCDGECLSKCNKNPDCRIQPVFVDSDFKFGTCVPKYPPGFASGSFSSALGGYASGASDESSGGTASDDVCGLATRTCTSTWIKKCTRGGWVVENNDKCHDPSFTIQMNNLCVSLGDCGVYANIAGKPILTGGRVKKDGGHGKTPPQPMIMGIAYMALSLTPATSPALGGGFDKASDILGLGSGVLSGIIDPFLGAMMDDTGDYGAGFEPSGFGTTGTALVAGGIGTVVMTGVTAIASSGTLFGSAVGVFGPFAVNPAGLVIVVIIVALSYAFGCGEVEQVEITYTCSASGPPVGADCEMCNGGDLKPCSRYKCESLGAGCELINENTGFDECVKRDGIDTTPEITPLEEALNQTMFQYMDESRNGVRIRTVDGECIQSNMAFSFGVQTDIPAVCLISEEPVAFEEMPGAFSEGAIFTRNHTNIISLPNAETLVYITLGDGEGEDQETYQDAYGEVYDAAVESVADYNLYVKCMNPMGDINEAEYKIDMCVNPGPDLMNPVVAATSPPENSILGFGITSQDAIFYINEPTQCKWDIVNPGLQSPLENYNILANTMTCDATTRDMAKGLYPCKTTLPITAGTNEFYVLCRDQPWLRENESRNIGATEGSFYRYSLTTSELGLSIDEIIPEGKITAGVEPITVNISAITSGGGYNGAATCGYELDGQNPEEHLYTEFLSTEDVSAHIQPGLQFLSGEHTIKVKCYDDAGNIAINETKVDVELDTASPSIVRAYRDGGLVIVTDEESKCFYDLESCNFDINSGTPITAGLSTRHMVEWNPSSTYFIKCKDKWENQASGCSMIVRPSQL
ncbi:hypothetical protein KAR91_38800 [Candidatus Pacearchaeota archaeon]|nr:hypothetical protein [Candidatus Pacearchaeota archaeon]